MARAATVLVGLLAALAIVAATASGGTGITRDQAYLTARACLLNHGATYVARWKHGGGFARLTRGRVYWGYATLGQDLSVTLTFAGEQPLRTEAQRTAVRNCVTKGIPLHGTAAQAEDYLEAWGGGRAVCMKRGKGFDCWHYAQHCLGRYHLVRGAFAGAAWGMTARAHSRNGRRCGEHSVVLGG